MIWYRSYIFKSIPASPELHVIGFGSHGRAQKYENHGKEGSWISEGEIENLRARNEAE